MDVDGVRRSRILERLKILKCSYLEGLEDSVIQELLFSEGEARYRLLKWLLGKIPCCDPSSLSAVKSDIGVVTKLTEILSILGVCSSNDYELVKGSTSLVRQIKFWDVTTEVVFTSSSLDDHQQDTRLPLDQQTEDACLFLESVICGRTLSSMFKPGAVSLIPADIAHVTGINDDNLKTTQVPCLSSLKKQMNEQKHATLELMSHLEKLNKQQTRSPLDMNAIDSYNAALTVSLDTMQQLMSDFSRCYYDDIEPWTKFDRPNSSSIGSVSRRVHSLIVLLNELLEDSIKLEEICKKWKVIISHERNFIKDPVEEQFFSTMQ